MCPCWSWWHRHRFCGVCWKWYASPYLWRAGSRKWEHQMVRAEVSSLPALVLVSPPPPPTPAGWLLALLLPSVDRLLTWKMIHRSQHFKESIFSYIAFCSCACLVPNVPCPFTGHCSGGGGGGGGGALCHGSKMHWQVWHYKIYYLPLFQKIYKLHVNELPIIWITLNLWRCMRLPFFPKASLSSSYFIMLSGCLRFLTLEPTVTGASCDNWSHVCVTYFFEGHYCLLCSFFVFV